MMKSFGANGISTSNNFELTTSAGTTQASINADSSAAQNHYNKANYAQHYRNPPLAPRFLASNQQQQQISTNNQGSSSSIIRMHQNLDNLFSTKQLPQQQQQQQQQPQKSTPTTTASTATSISTVSTTPNVLSLSANQQSNLNITSGNSLQSFIAARGLANGLNNANSFNQQNNSGNPGLNLLNQIQNQQQQQQQTPCSSITNSATTALIANLAAAATTQNFSQSLPQCTLNNTLFVGNLHASLQEIDLIQVFRPFGRIVECCKKWLHFGFVKFSTEEEACRAYVTLNGFRLKGRPMRLEFQNRTKKARIKAILAQAALQAANKIPNENEDIFASAASPLNMLLKTNCQNDFKPGHTVLTGSTGTTTFNPNATKFMPQSMIRKEEVSRNDLSFFDAEKLLKFAASPFDLQNNQDNEIKMANYVEMAWSSADMGNKENQAPHFDNKRNIDLPWMNDISIGININNIISSANSPVQDDNASSSSTSSVMSHSLDSGFRSTSYIGEEEEAKQISKGFPNATTTTTATTIINKHLNDVLLSRCDTPLECTSSISEHLEFTYSHSTTSANKLDLKNVQIQNWSNKVDAAHSTGTGSVSSAAVSTNCSDHAESDDEDDDCDSKSCVSTSDTSDDASIINDDFSHDDTSTQSTTTTTDTTAQVSLSQSMTTNATTAAAGASNQIQEFNSINYYNTHSTHTSTKYTQQLIKDVESFMKKSLDFGIYSCMNKTNSFFVEPEDVLRPLNQDDYNEYQLFPMMEARFVDSYPEFF